MTLAEDLVTTAKAALALAAVQGHLPSTREPLPFQSIARVAAVAVLRNVITDLRAEGTVGTPDWRDAYTQAANDLEMLADEIEFDLSGATQAGTP